MTLLPLHLVVNWPVFTIFLSYQTIRVHDVDVLCKESHERFLRMTGLLRHAVLRSLTAQYSFLQFDSIFVVFLGLRALYIMFYVLCKAVCFIMLPTKAK